MFTIEYFQLISDNFTLYIWIYIGVCIFYYLIFRKYCLSLFDPLLFHLFFSASAAVVPVFLFAVNAIPVNLFLSYLATQIAFIIGFLLFKPIRINKIMNSNHTETIPDDGIKFTKWLFVNIAILNIIFQLVSFWLFEIPLFATTSRLLVFGEAGGWGQIFNRTLNITFPSSIFLSIYFALNGKTNIKRFAKFNICLLFIFAILRGARGAFIIFGTAFFICAIYSLRWNEHFLYNVIKKYIFKIILVGVIGVFGTTLWLSTIEQNPFSAFIFRIAQSGDVFYMAYPNYVIDRIPRPSNWFVNIFSGPLSLLGLIDRSLVPQPIGFFLVEYHTRGEIIGQGPNARMNVFGYVFIGKYPAIIFCFILGMIFSFVRNKMFFILPKNIFGAILYFLLLSSASALEIDFFLALGSFVNIMVIFMPIALVSYFFSVPNEKKS